MAPKLYGTIISPPVRAVLLCAKAIGVDLEFVEVDLLKGGHTEPGFVKINPLHTVPVLDDDGFTLIDSHAIMAYLVDSYAKDKSLYPEDVKKRARVNQLLHFDSGTFFPRHRKTGVAIVFEGAKSVSEENNKAVNEAYGFIESFLRDSKYVAGDALTIADFSVFTTLSNATILVPLDEGKYPKLRAWQRNLETLPYDSINKNGRDVIEEVVKAVLSK